MEINKGIIIHHDVLARTACNRQEEQNKKKRVDRKRKLETVIQDLGEQQNRHREARDLDDLWTKVLEMVTSVDRIEKPEDLSWADHFQNLLGKEIPDMPQIFVDDDLKYHEMIVKVGSYLDQRNKDGVKRLKSIKTSLEKKRKREATLAKTDTRLRARVDEIVNNPALVKEEKEKKRLLDT